MAVEVIGESGPTAMSLRDLARGAGVSHAAPAHHFGDRAGLLTAVAIEGFDLLADALRATQGDLLEIGVAYVGFAVDHRAHHEVMFRPDLRTGDAKLHAAKGHARAALRGGVAGLPKSRRTVADAEGDALAAWSIVHGFATLWLAGALPDEVGDDPRAVIRRLFQDEG